MDTAVGLVQAYLHLNGYLVLTEVPVQMQSGDIYRTVTDLDVLAVRFPQQDDAFPDRTEDWEAFFRGADPALDPNNAGMDVIIGEVKEGDSHANPALRRTATIHFALRRIGCCSGAALPHTVAEIVERGESYIPMIGGGQCRVRLVVFGGHGARHDEGLLELPLRHLALWVRERIAAYRPVMRGVEFKDSTLAFFRLLDKLHLDLDPGESRPAPIPPEEFPPLRRPLRRPRNRPR